MLMDYGNRDVRVLCNMRPIHSAGVITGQQNYPDLKELGKAYPGNFPARPALSTP
ncbi:MAG: hypothetical protein R2941_12030 [Desulfobacterales bacterium]